MKVLKVGRKYFEFCEIFPREKTKLCEKIQKYAVNLFFIIGLCSFWCASLFYIYFEIGEVSDQINALINFMAGILYWNHVKWPKSQVFAQRIVDYREKW